ncbi:hypothetical protein [Nocardioides sp. KR10-350]|uniref:hypothetical protein n=1 Tax=Nocardioides cheoyonin TaxID=3156615 RepID=UPI0032B5988E
MAGPTDEPEAYDAAFLTTRDRARQAGGSVLAALVDAGLLTEAEALGADGDPGTEAAFGEHEPGAGEREGR